MQKYNILGENKNIFLFSCLETSVDHIPACRYHAGASHILASKYSATLARAYNYRDCSSYEEPKALIIVATS